MDRNGKTYTIDGVEVIPGLRVWNYNLEADEVLHKDEYGNPYESEWWITDKGIFDGARMWAFHPTTGARA